jgi:hypothetical protein
MGKHVCVAFGCVLLLTGWMAIAE